MRRVEHISDRLQTDEAVIRAIETVAGCRFPYQTEECWGNRAWQIWDNPTAEEWEAVRVIAFNSVPETFQTLPWGIDCIRRGDGIERG